jgi:hypothetical protein
VTMAPEPPPRGERLRPVNQLAMNSRLPKWMALPRENPSHRKRSLPVAAMNANDGTVGMV